MWFIATKDKDGRERKLLVTNKTTADTILWVLSLNGLPAECRQVTVYKDPNTGCLWCIDPFTQRQIWVKNEMVLRMCGYSELSDTYEAVLSQGGSYDEQIHL